MRTLVASVLISGAYGHGWLTRPLSRASLNSSWEANGTCGYYCQSHQSTGPNVCDGLPCGDCHLPGDGGNCTAGAYPGQAIPKEPYCNPNQFPDTSYLETPGPIQAAYRAGDVVEVAWVVSVNHRGMYQYRLCLDGSDTEACFKKTQLRFEDGTFWRDLPSPCTTCTGTAPDHGATVPLMVDRVVIPSDVQCDRCTLSWRWDAWYESTVFTGCADVSITGDQLLSGACHIGGLCSILVFVSAVFLFPID